MLVPVLPKGIVPSKFRNCQKGSEPAACCIVECTCGIGVNLRSDCVFGCSSRVALFGSGLKSQGATRLTMDEFDHTKWEMVKASCTHATEVAYLSIGIRLYDEQCIFGSEQHMLPMDWAQKYVHQRSESTAERALIFALDFGRLGYTVLHTTQRKHFHVTRFDSWLHREEPSMVLCLETIKAWDMESSPHTVWLVGIPPKFNPELDLTGKDAGMVHNLLRYDTWDTCSKRPFGPISRGWVDSFQIKVGQKRPIPHAGKQRSIDKRILICWLKKVTSDDPPHTDCCVSVLSAMDSQEFPKLVLHSERRGNSPPYLAVRVKWAVPPGCMFERFISFMAVRKPFFRVTGEEARIRYLEVEGYVADAWRIGPQFSLAVQEYIRYETWEKNERWKPGSPELQGKGEWECVDEARPPLEGGRNQGEGGEEYEDGAWDWSTNLGNRWFETPSKEARQDEFARRNEFARVDLREDIEYARQRKDSRNRSRSQDGRRQGSGSSGFRSVWEDARGTKHMREEPVWVSTGNTVPGKGGSRSKATTWENQSRRWEEHESTRREFQRTKSGAFICSHRGHRSDDQDPEQLELAGTTFHEHLDRAYPLLTKLYDVPADRHQYIVGMPGMAPRNTVLDFLFVEVGMATLRTARPCSASLELQGVRFSPWNPTIFMNKDSMASVLSVVGGNVDPANSIWIYEEPYVSDMDVIHLNLQDNTMSGDALTASLPYRKLFVAWWEVRSDGTIAYREQLVDYAFRKGADCLFSKVVKVECGCVPCAQCDGCNEVSVSSCADGVHCALCESWQTGRWRDCCAFTESPFLQFNNLDLEVLAENLPPPRRLWGDVLRPTDPYMNGVQRQLFDEPRRAMCPPRYPVEWLSNKMVQHSSIYHYVRHVRCSSFMAIPIPRGASVVKPIEIVLLEELPLEQLLNIADQLLSNPSWKSQRMCVSAEMVIACIDPRLRTSQCNLEEHSTEIHYLQVLVTLVQNRLFGEPESSAEIVKREASPITPKEVQDQVKTEFVPKAPDKVKKEFVPKSIPTPPAQDPWESDVDCADKGEVDNDYAMLVGDYMPQLELRPECPQCGFRSKSSNFSSDVYEDPWGVMHGAKLMPRAMDDGFTLRFIQFLYSVCHTQQNLLDCVKEYYMFCFPDMYCKMYHQRRHPCTAHLGVLGQPITHGQTGKKSGEETRNRVAARYAIFDHFLGYSFKTREIQEHREVINDAMERLSAETVTIEIRWMTSLCTAAKRRKQEARYGKKGLEFLLEWEALITAPDVLPPGLTMEEIEHFDIHGLTEYTPTEVVSELKRCLQQGCGLFTAVALGDLGVHGERARKNRKIILERKWISSDTRVDLPDRIWKDLVLGHRITDSDAQDVLAYTGGVPINMGHLKKQGPPQFRSLPEIPPTEEMVETTLCYLFTRYAVRSKSTPDRDAWYDESLDYGSGWQAVLLAATIAPKDSTIRKMIGKHEIPFAMKVGALLQARQMVWQRWTNFGLAMGVLGGRYALDARVVRDVFESTLTFATTNSPEHFWYLVDSVNMLPLIGCHILKLHGVHELGWSGQYELAQDKARIGWVVRTADQFFAADDSHVEKWRAIEAAAEDLKGMWPRGNVVVGPVVDSKQKQYVVVKFGKGWSDCPLADWRYFNECVDRQDGVDWCIHGSSPLGAAKWIVGSNGFSSPGAATWNDLMHSQVGVNNAPDHARVCVAADTKYGAFEKDPRVLMGSMVYPVSAGYSAEAFPVESMNHFDSDHVLILTAAEKALHSEGNHKCQSGQNTLEQKFMWAPDAEKDFKSTMSKGQGLNISIREGVIKYLDPRAVMSYKPANAVNRKALLIQPHGLQPRLLFVPRGSFGSFVKMCKIQVGKRAELTKMVAGWDPAQGAPPNESSFIFPRFSAPSAMNQGA